MAVVLCVTLVSCKNTIMEKWWDTSSESAITTGPTQLYVNGVLKMEAKLSDIFAWIKSNIANNTYYTIRVGSDASLSPDEGRLHYPGNTGANISLAGIKADRTITITNSVRGSLFDVGDNVTFVLGENITLKGHSGNNKALVMVSSGGTMIMKDSAKIVGNTNKYEKVPWAAGGEREPEAANGGGICVIGGNFIMYGGAIYNNKTNLNGAGIILFNSTGIMNGGKIYQNEATYDGGGINVSSSSFIMRGGEIYANKAGWGGGVRVNINNSRYYFRKEPPEGSLVSGIIYGSDAGNNLANKALTYGNAVAQYGTFAAKRDRTLYEKDTISTANRNVGWE